MIKLHFGDCLEIMPEIPDKSIDMILCDLPYGTTSSPWDVVIDFEELWDQYLRIIKPNRAIVLFGIQPFTTKLISSKMEVFKYTMVWNKVKTTGYQIAKIKPLSCHEDLCVFGIGKLLYNPQKTKRDKPRVRTGRVWSEHIAKVPEYNDTRVYDERYPTSIITISNGSNKDRIHPNQKPVELCEYLIKTYSNEGDTVLDNCMGSGATIIAALNTKRSAIGIEKDKEHFLNANTRIMTEFQRRKTMTL